MDVPPIWGESTLEGRLAQVAKALLVRMARPMPLKPDTSDFREVFRAHVHRELLLARLMGRLEEAFQSSTYARIKDLLLEIARVKQEIEESRP